MLSAAVCGTDHECILNVVGEITRIQRLWHLGLPEMIILKRMILGCDVAECDVWCVVLRDSEMNIRVP